MDEKIILDEKSFKALSADSRINILKSLAERRRTLSELSQKLLLGSSTIKEHCDILTEAGLIAQHDEGRKWKYYELTSKGKQIIKPNFMEEIKVLIVLSIATVIVGGFVYMLLAGFGNFGVSESGSRLMTADSSQKVLSNEPTLTGSYSSTSASETNVFVQNTTNGVSNEFYVGSLILSIIFGMVLGWIFVRKR